MIGCGDSGQQMDISYPGQSIANPDTIIANDFRYGRGALLLTRFGSLDEFKKVVQVIYLPDTLHFTSTSKAGAVLLHYSMGGTVVSQLFEGVKESDFSKARAGGFMERMKLSLKTPYALIHRKELRAIELLGRVRPALFGIGDIAFYHLAETMVFNLREEDRLRMEVSDLGEKGYLNTFNHVTAQAIMTSLFSEALADFVADVHEREKMPELIDGQFSMRQIEDIQNGAVDNYLDIINNEWGQELGKDLKERFAIQPEMHWTPGLVSDYLNEVQSYFSWAFGISFRPFTPTDDIVVRFAGKLNKVLHEM